LYQDAVNLSECGFEARWFRGTASLQEFFITDVPTVGQKAEAQAARFN
jgi:hypothetical protein